MTRLMQHQRRSEHELSLHQRQRAQQRATRALDKDDTAFLLPPHEAFSDTPNHPLSPSPFPLIDPLLSRIYSTRSGQQGAGERQGGLRRRKVGGGGVTAVWCCCRMAVRSIPQTTFYDHDWWLDVERRQAPRSLSPRIPPPHPGQIKPIKGGSGSVGGEGVFGWSGWDWNAVVEAAAAATAYAGLQQDKKALDSEEGGNKTRRRLSHSGNKDKRLLLDAQVSLLCVTERGRRRRSMVALGPEGMCVIGPCVIGPWYVCDRT